MSGYIFRRRTIMQPTILSGFGGLLHSCHLLEGIVIYISYGIGEENHSMQYIIHTDI